MSIWNSISGLLGRAQETIGSSDGIGGFFRDLVGGGQHADGETTTAPQHGVPFTMAVIALCAKMAKADGVVTDIEVKAFREVFKVPEAEAGNVRRLFDLAKQDVAGFESYAKQISGMLGDDRQSLRDVLEGLFYIAASDGILHPGEAEYLQEVATHFGFNDAEFRSIRALFVHDVDGPYEVLGVTADIADTDLRQHYRKLVSENHPDRLMGRGVPAEFVEVANKKLAAINEAYDTIAKERGI